MLSYPNFFRAIEWLRDDGEAGAPKVCLFGPLLNKRVYMYSIIS